MMCSRTMSKSKFLKGQKESGQIAVEYVLLLVAAVGIAILLQSSLASRNPESPGLIVRAWDGIIQVIAADSTDSF